MTREQKGKEEERSNAPPLLVANVARSARKWAIAGGLKSLLVHSRRYTVEGLRWHTSMERSTKHELSDVANTVGDVPRAWYRGERHAGYTQGGLKLLHRRETDSLETLLQSIDDRSSWRVLLDEKNGSRFRLTAQQVRMIQRLDDGFLPTSEGGSSTSITLLDSSSDGCTQMAEPKRRFVPSKHEARKVVSLVRQLRQAANDPRAYLDRNERERNFDIWATETAGSESSNSRTRAPKALRAGNELSYNAPIEYLGDSSPIDRKSSLRNLSSNINFVKECFNRCLDLYLCPRVERQVLRINPASILPKTPEISSLKPFPHILAVKYTGLKSEVRAISINDTGELLCSGASDGKLRLWDILSGHCIQATCFDAPITCISWRPGSDRDIAVCSGKHVSIISTATVLGLVSGMDVDLSWTKSEFGECSVRLSCAPISISWHNKGDYFSSVEKESGRLCVNQLSTFSSQVVFSSARNHITHSIFHPRKAMIFTSTRSSVQVFDIREHRQVQKLRAGNSTISAFSIDHSGDIVAICGNDSRVYLFDTAISSSPSKVIQLQSGTGIASCFHPRLPLFGVALSIGLMQVFYLRLDDDLLREPAIVPLKLIRVPGDDSAGAVKCTFHPRQPWIICARGANSFLFTD